MVSGLLEGEVQYSSAWESLTKMNWWAVVATGKDLLIPQQAWRHGVLWEEFDQKEAVVYRKGWWKSGEWSLTKTKTKIQVWVSKNLAIPSLRIEGSENTRQERRKTFKYKGIFSLSHVLRITSSGNHVYMMMIFYISDS